MRRAWWMLLICCFLISFMAHGDEWSELQLVRDNYARIKKKIEDKLAKNIKPDGGDVRRLKIVESNLNAREESLKIPQAQRTVRIVKSGLWYPVEKFEDPPPSRARPANSAETSKPNPAPPPPPAQPAPPPAPGNAPPPGSGASSAPPKPEAFRPGAAEANASTAGTTAGATTEAAAKTAADTAVTDTSQAVSAYQRTMNRLAGGSMGQFRLNKTFVVVPFTMGTSILIETDIEGSLDKGICPALPGFATGSAIAYPIVVQADFGSVQRAAKNCASQSKPFKFEDRLGQILKADRPGFSRVTCDAAGVIKIVHRNGTMSEVQFSANDTVASIRSYAPDDPDHLKMTYQMSDAESKTPWLVRTEIRMDDRTLKINDQLYQFSNRLNCMTNSCDELTLRSKFNVNDEITTGRRPFGMFQTSKTKAIGSSLIAVKEALSSSFLTNLSYARTCEQLGGHAPEGSVQFTLPDGVSAGAGAPAGGSEGRSSRAHI